MLNLKAKFICTISIIFFLSFCSLQLCAQTPAEVIKASYFVAFGRYPTSSEANYWRNNVGNKTIAQMVDLHRSYIKSNQGEREQTVRRSYQDAFGWQPSADELRYWSGQFKTYAQLMTNHVQNWLGVYPDKKSLVIRQSYYKVFGRTASAEELKYWMAQPTYSFVQLVGIHTTWKMKQQQNSRMTPMAGNINGNGISTASLSPQAISGVVSAGGANVIAPGGANVIAAGGANVVAAGGLN